MTMIIISRTPKETPTPIPIFAPGAMPDDCLRSLDEVEEVNGTSAVVLEVEEVNGTSGLLEAIVCENTDDVVEATPKTGSSVSPWPASQHPEDESLFPQHQVPALHEVIS